MNGPLSDYPGLESAVRDAQEVSARLWDRGWAESSAGNLSMDVSDLCGGMPAMPASSRRLPQAFPGLAGRTLLVSGSGCRFRDFALDAERTSLLLRVDDVGASCSVAWGGAGDGGLRPTSELPTHLAIHDEIARRGWGLSTVLHTHPTELIALSHLEDCRVEAEMNRLLWSTTPEVKIFLPHGVGLVPYRVTGSGDLAEATRSAVARGRRVAVWQFHGALALGRSADEAFDRLDVANKAARVALLFRAAGQQGGGLGAAELAELERLSPPKP